MKKKTSVPASVPQKHIYSRISYLHQAASYFTKRRLSELNPENQEINAEPATESTNVDPKEPRVTAKPAKTQSQHGAGPSRYLLSHVRGVSLKGQARLNSTLKRSICRRCDAVLVAGVTSNSHIENKSNGGTKPWADVLVITCNSCDASKRFPVGATRQISKTTQQK